MIADFFLSFCITFIKQVFTDPMTGQEKTRKKLGGAYPGQRRPPNQPYLPPAHFVAYGGGNALTLVKQDGSHQPEAGKAQSEYIQGTLRLVMFMFCCSLPSCLIYYCKYTM
jgi:hypothetical protein